jgi:hypothetical protein
MWYLIARNGVIPQLVGKFNIASGSQGIIKADLKRQRRLIADLVSNANHVLNALSDRLGLHLRVTPVQHHTLNLIGKEGK